ncbi:hypothetical protein BHYA_0028g00540 [Botrytis hyacinthi]|uniref:Heterokaryon incompatibility domain-containing protein n=1 Tax=Botrytis hyacinthi TaxID=278943 RepID=A0A4Z1H058_9HELO|nr:hypothetical protein BHYA_0028g00540 [Botrytis hyacinthi]
MLCLVFVFETVDWILVDPLKSVYAKNVTHKSKDSSASYQYGILRKGYIRLVSIKAGNPDDPIELEMNHVKFHPVAIYGDLPPFFPNVPTYEALSYAWGESEDTVYTQCLDIQVEFEQSQLRYRRPIKLNGQPFNITPNLHSALHVLRDNSSSSSLWINAICLDQNDPSEKDKQLQIMYLIYMNATRVLVWLGEDDKSVDLHAAAEIISHFRMKKRKLQRKSQSIAEKEPSADFQVWLQKWVNCDWHTGPEYVSGWKAVQNILARSYPTRPRIIQEIVLSSNRKILVGHHDVTDILDLVSVIHIFPQIENRIPAQYLNEPDVIPRIYELSSAMQTYRTVLKSMYAVPGTNREFKLAGQNELNLGEFLARFRDKKSTLPTDQVYSVLGMTIDASIVYKMPSWTSWSRKRPTQRLPQFTHRQSLRKLCSDTTRYILEEDGDLGALRMINTHAKPTKYKDWPSWVPDFSSLLPGPGEPESTQWNLESSTFPQNMNKFFVDRGRLIVYGHVLGEIEGLVRTIQRNGDYSNKTGDRQSELKKGILRLSQYRDGFGFLPLALSRDSEGRYVFGGTSMKKGDLVVVVGRGRDPLILRRLEHGEEPGGDSKKESIETPAYQLVATANIPGIKRIQKKLALDDIQWDVKEMIIK